MQTLIELIDTQAKLRANDTYLSFCGHATRFGELQRRVRQAAGAFQRAGFSSDQRVAMMMGNSPLHAFAYMALVALGCVVVEFSIHFRVSGIQLQLEDCDPHHVIVDTDFIEDFAAAMDGLGRAGPLTTLASCNHPRALFLALDDAEPTCELPSPSLERVQSISYTSGTTGRPKGVILTERFFQVGSKNAALLADVRWGDVFFLWEPFYHVAAWMTFIAALQHGVKVALVERFSATHCWDQIRQSGATLFHYLGGAMNILLKLPQSGRDADNPVRIAWGAAAPARSWREFEKRFNVAIREGYGISEAGNFTHLNVDGRVGSIGKPVDEFEAWIAADDGQRAPAGVIGEIVVKPKASNITMVGYFRNPERTAEVLREGCVFTGDLGYMDADGFFYYSGRKKDSLRRRGENVSAWEVERVINAHPSVEESAVIGVASDMGEQEIRVFVQLAPNQSLEPLNLIKWCERDLAYYQIPRYIDFVAEFPRGPTQRIRKSDLPVALDASWDLEHSGYKIRR